MGKNFKEQASYDLLHNKSVKSSKLECIVRKNGVAIIFIGYGTRNIEIC